MSATSCGFVWYSCVRPVTSCVVLSLTSCVVPSVTSCGSCGYFQLFFGYCLRFFLLCIHIFRSIYFLSFYLQGLVSRFFCYFPWFWLLLMWFCSTTFSLPFILSAISLWFCLLLPVVLFTISCGLVCCYCNVVLNSAVTSCGLFTTSCGHWLLSVVLPNMYFLSFCLLYTSYDSVCYCCGSVATSCRFVFFILCFCLLFPTLYFWLFYLLDSLGLCATATSCVPICFLSGLGV